MPASMWRFRVDHYFHPPESGGAQSCAALAPLVVQLTELKGIIMSTQAQLAADILAVAEKVNKVGSETRTLLAKISDLQAAVENAGTVAPEVAEAMTALQTQVDVVDGLVPDAAATAAA